MISSVFRSKDQQLELVSLDDFYANAPPELTDPVGNVATPFDRLFEDFRLENHGKRSSSSSFIST